MTKVKTNVFYASLVAILLTLLIVRLVLPDEACSWVSSVNYGGFVIAAAALFFNMSHEYRQFPKFYPIAGFSILLLIALTVLGALILTNVIVLNNKFDDSITLLTLFISLPAPLYVELMGHYLKR